MVAHHGRVIADASPVTTYGTWVSYTGAARVVLGVVLLVLAAVLAWLGRRVRAPMRVSGPGGVVLGFLLAIWILGLMAVAVGVLIIVAQVQQVPVEHPQLTDPITPVTGLAALVLFMILMVTSSYTGWTQLLTAVIGAVAAPMVFELPFDLIVMTRTYPPVPPHPALYRAVFFVPLFLVEVTTLALLTWPPAFRVTRAALVLLASMFAVFAVWMLLAGFAHPAAPLPIAANVASKLLAFTVVAGVLLPARTPTASQT